MMCGMKRLLLRASLSFFIFFFVFDVSADVASSDDLSLAPSAEADLNSSQSEPFFSYRITQDVDQERNEVWPALVSFVLPGFGQWYEGQYRSAVVYSVYGAAGLGVSMSLHNDVKNLNNSLSEREVGEAPLNSRQMWYAFSSQSYQAAGMISAFHSFRSGAEAQKKNGKYLFLTHEETTGDLILAPLKFSYLARPTSLIPLVILGALIHFDKDKASHFKFSRSDSLLTAGLSFNAGVSEEAFFRGTMMPFIKNEGASDFWANALTALFFGAAHIDKENPFPIAQTLGGYYFGYLTQKNEWTMSEAVFVHFWWDVIAIGAELASSRGQSAYIPLFSTSF